ncbi:C40 family peptidase [Bacillus sp. 165]|uniref:C40 family peptidase n=1 Tax=Bacillus sp. 165 TaxID=1529117 RepID=UPI001ADC7F76|nr:C40 family peptidase [Bacillus sp. 165]MBO9130099.1 C40 family peptidase [Bacillus sp. 165]
MKATVRVPVANVWTHPVEGEWLKLALAASGWMKYWIDSLAHKERMKLYEDNLMQTQVLLGDQVEILKEEGEWAEVAVLSQASSKNEQGYPGWMHKSQLEQGVSGQKRHFVIMVPEALLWDEEESSKQSIVFQTTLPVIKEEGEWTFVAVPDGIRKIKSEAGIVINGMQPVDKKQGNDLLAYGIQFLGLPYLWGGMSAWGYDCSGLTHTLAKACGYSIPRDAHDQAKMGVEVAKEAWLPGDLLFFARNGKIHHVGVYAGEGKMLHAPMTGSSIEILDLAGTYYEGALCNIRRVWNA